MGIVASGLPSKLGYGEIVFRFSGCAGRIALKWKNGRQSWIACIGLGADPHPRFVNVRKRVERLGQIEIGYHLVRPD